jgi:hypothetical protein
MGEGTGVRFRGGGVVPEGRSPYLLQGGTTPFERA